MVFENKGHWDKNRHKNIYYSVYSIVPQCLNLLENAEKLPEETAGHIAARLSVRGDLVDDRKSRGKIVPSSVL